MNDDSQQRPHWRFEDLEIARRSLFEDASMLMVFQRMSLLREEEMGPLLVRADTLSRKITKFSKSLE